MSARYSFLLIATFMGGAVFAQVKAKGVGFYAPAFLGSFYADTPEKGAIILDTDENVFKGNLGTPDSPDWVNLSSESRLPTGTVIATAATNCPAGTLLAEGSPVSRSTYAELFAAIGTTYGAGDGLTTFNLPNTKGVFIRGAGSQAISGITYTSASFGTVQGDLMQNFKVPLYTSYGANIPTGTTRYLGDSNTGTTYGTPNSGNPVDGGNGTPRVGDETRPANLVLKYCIAE